MNFVAKITKFQSLGLSLFFLSFALLQFASISPEIVEQYYTRGIYLYISATMSWLHSWSPMSLTLFAFAIAFLSPFWILMRSIRKGLLPSLLNVLATLGFIYSFFLFAWGFNYHRLPIANLLDLPKISEKESIENFYRTVDRFKDLHLESPSSEFCSNGHTEMMEEEPRIRRLVEDFLTQRGFPLVARAKAKPHFWGKFWLSLGVGGIYSPFSAETNVTIPASPHSLPFLIAHELAHLYGFATEDAASIIAVMALSESSEERDRLSVMLQLFFSAPKSFRKNLPDQFEELRQCRKYFSRNHPSFATWITRPIYSRYLKAQGVKSGIKNYSEVFQLAMAAMKKGDITWKPSPAETHQ